ncbi:hypothetical protein ACQUW5_12080 [Legionella sp. CNM-1927-20]|uniref:hypothetical protein n=1 Tax=Legionella sp. CNM-1927-20 TaxID=3422221 RepID=UPI00403B0DCA
MKSILVQFFNLSTSRPQQQADLTKTKKVKVIAINISHKDPEFISYKLNKNTQEKMALILEKVKSAYEIAHNLDPDSEILITWREYGLTDEKRSKSIDNKDKRMFLAEIQKLVRTNPTLSVLVGPTLIRKEQTSEAISRLEKYYNELSWIDKLEKPDVPNIWGKPTVNKHFRDNQKVITDMVGKPTFSIVKNSAYFLRKDSIQPIAKKAPYGEIEEHTAIDFSKYYGADSCKREPYTVFRPGKGRSKNSFFTLPNDKQALLQICREHWLGAAVPLNMQNEIVDAHFVLSASISPQLDKIRGKHTFFVDNDYFPLHLVRNIEDLADDSIDLSVLSLFDNSNTLVKVRSFCPIQFYLISFLENLPYADGSCKSFVDVLRHHIKLGPIFEISEYEKIIKLINKEYIESNNSPEKRVMLYEAMLRVVEELQIRYGKEFVDKFLSKNNKVPINKKDLVTDTLVEAWMLEDFNYLRKTATIAGIDLNEKDSAGLFIYDLGSYTSLRNEPDQPLDVDQTDDRAQVGDADADQPNDGAQVDDADADQPNDGAQVGDVHVEQVNDISQDLLKLTF